MSDIEQMAEYLARTINSRASETGDHVYASDLIDLVRAVVVDELDKAVQRQEQMQKLATQAHWDSDQFTAQVDALRGGRPVSGVTAEVTRCDACGYRTLRPDGSCSWCGADYRRSLGAR